MNDQQLLRYARHLLLDEIGIEGQERILAGNALIVGAGGLGSPAAMFLAAAGIGRLRVIDDDVVDLTNLQRQIAHTTARVGQPKVDSLGQAVAALNPEVVFEGTRVRMGGTDADALLRRWVAEADVVLDCTDNFATRHCLNRWCVAAGRPLVSGAAIRFEGQLAVYDTREADSPCYACLFPEAAEDIAPVSCATMGVFSPLVGVVGSAQAAEALKLLTGAGTTLRGRLLRMDLLHAEWRPVRVRRDPECPVCAQRPSGTEPASVVAAAAPPPGSARNAA
ncbi:MAG: molybdopterin-synthase adenylyltransferase MoeB [Pigmentiphaga sp.]|nr:molybdopterin-synthase adenylyltransferase MoeB [Pigmentiphaga sp.]